MIEREGGKLDELFFTSEKYDVVVIGSAYDFETVAAIKIVVM